jgi:hypothetical protein
VPGVFDGLYRTVVKAARLEGFGHTSVPDFLEGVDDGAPIQMLGQQELGPVEVAAALDKLAGEQRAIGSTLTPACA